MPWKSPRTWDSPVYHASRNTSPVSSGEAEHDPMLQRIYDGLNQDIFTISKQPDPIVYIEDIEAYNKQEGLALSDEEVAYLNEVSQKLERRLTDSEVYGFAQVNSEHCRHKIFGGTFIIDGEEKESSLFNLIKKTSAENPNKLVSAYKDNVAFNEGPVIEQFAPASGDKPDFYEVKEIKSVISLKAETPQLPRQQSNRSTVRLPDRVVKSVTVWAVENHPCRLPEQPFI